MMRRNERGEESSEEGKERRGESSEGVGRTRRKEEGEKRPCLRKINSSVN